MSEFKLYFGIIDYDVDDDCRFYLLFSCISTTVEKFKSRIYDKTLVEDKFKDHLRVLEFVEEVDNQIPEWFVKFNTSRYNGEGIYKEYYDYPLINTEAKTKEQLHTLEGLTFCNVDYFATGEGRLTIYMCTTETDEAKIRQTFQDQMKVDDYFMICFEITPAHEIEKQYPEWFRLINAQRTNGFGAFQTYQNLS
jgi:hypothetical protein